MRLPKQTAELFKILSRGQFISSNSSDKNLSELYNVIDEGDHFDLLYDYFSNINFILERGDEYFYFSRPETKVDLENKLRAAGRWIDILDFFKTYNSSFGSGFRFSPSDILVRLKTDLDLEEKLKSLKSQTGGEKYHEILEKLLKRLSDDSFIELENNITREYKVLASFKYLEDLMSLIKIDDDAVSE